MHRLDNEGMISEILREVSVLEDIDDTTGGISARGYR